MTDSYTFGTTRGNGLRVSEEELKNQLDRERLRNNPSEFFGTDQFGEIVDLQPLKITIMQTML